MKPLGTMLFVLLLIPLLMLASRPGLCAQEPSSLAGTVQDKSGAMIAGAAVRISKGAEWSQTAATNERGEYVILGLRPGTYMVVISVSGFKDFQVANVSLAAGQEARLDATLEPSEVSAKVTVEGQTTSKIETESSQISGTITEKELTKLGLNGRNFTQLIVLAPGVSNQTGQDEARVGVKGSVKYSVNGGRVEYNTFDVDGSDVLNASISRSESSLVVYPSLDALSEVQVLTSNYGAQYGKSASGSVLVTTKSGTEGFHGDLYYFNRNEAFNARNFFDQTSKAPLYRKHDLGFTVGGPLFIPGHYNKAREKTFFFWSEELRRERDPEDFNFNTAVPSLAERDGNFSDVCPFARPGFDVEFKPAQYPDCPPGRIDGNTLPARYFTFPGNQIPREEFKPNGNRNSYFIDPVAKALLSINVIPLPNSVTGCSSSINSCFNTVVSPDTYWREELFRLDHNFGSNLRGSFRYIHDEWNTTVPTPQWPYSGQRNSFPTIQNDFYGPGLSMVARATETISNSLINDLLLSYTTAHITLTNISGLGAQLQRPEALSAMGSLFDNGFGGKIPGIVIGGTNAAYGGVGFRVDSSYMPWQFANPTYGLRDDVSKVAGKHYLQFGTQLVVAQKNEINPPVGANTGNLAGILTFDNAGGGNAFANFLVGNIRSFQQDSAQRKYYNRFLTAEPYAQDTWHMTKRLTLNLGIRVSLFGTFHEKNLNAWNFDPQLFNPALAAQVNIDRDHGNLADATNPPGCGTALVRCTPITLDLQNLDPRITNGLTQCGRTITAGNGTAYNVPESCMQGHLFNPAPRIGFAWDPTGRGKTSMRGGYGIFFEHGTGNETNTGSLEGSAPLVLDMTQSFPFAYKFIGEFGSTKVAFPLNLTAIQKKAVWPYMQQWSLSVQQEFGANLLASLAYVGSKGTHLTAEQQINQLRPVDLANNPFAPGVPLTRSICQTYILALNAFTVGQQSIDKSDPAYVNILAACIGTGVRPFSNPQALLFPPDANGLRQAFPGFGQIFLLSNVANSSYHALQSTLRRTKGPLVLSLSYSYSHSLDNSSDRSDATFVNAFDLRSNKARSNFDQRHLLNLSYILQLDFERIATRVAHTLTNPPSFSDDDDTTKTESASPRNNPRPVHKGVAFGVLDTLFQDWQVSGLTTYQTGTPFTIINGGSSTGLSLLDNAGVANGTGAGSYPDIIGDAHAPLGVLHDVAGSFGPLLGNPSAFGAPRGLTFGNAGRNFLSNPSRINFDMSLLKYVKLRESKSLEFRAEAFNIFNHTQFRLYNPDKGNTASNTISCYGGPNLSAAGGTNTDGTTTDCLTGNSFLHPVDAHRPRTMQFGLKLYF